MSSDGRKGLLCLSGLRVLSVVRRRGGMADKGGAQCAAVGVNRSSIVSEQMMKERTKRDSKCSTAASSFRVCSIPCGTLVPHSPSGWLSLLC